MSFRRTVTRPIVFEKCSQGVAQLDHNPFYGENVPNAWPPLAMQFSCLD